MLQTSFTQRGLKGKLGTPKALKGYFDTRVLEGHSGTQDTWAIEHSKGTKILSYLDTQGTLFSRLNICNNQNCYKFKPS